MFEVGDMIRFKFPHAVTEQYDTIVITEVAQEGVYGECINETVDIVGYSSRYIAVINLEYWEKL